MAVQVSYPGVYIEEFAPGAPIQGVGTSTAVFIGPTSSGPLNEAKKIASWDQFLQSYGDPVAGFYLWYAVRGFFENGGKICYIFRVSNAKTDGLILKDRSAGGGQDTIRIWAKKPGVSAPVISVKTAEAHAVQATSAKLFNPSATVSNGSGSSVKVTNVADAAKFIPGDVVIVNSGVAGSTPEESKIVRVENDLIRLAPSLSANYTVGTVTLKSPKAGDKSLRIVGADKLSGGSVIKLAQAPGGGAAVEDIVEVRTVIAQRISSTLTTYGVELRKGLKKNFDLTAGDVTVESQEFTLTVLEGGIEKKDYGELSMDPEHPRYFSQVINGDATGLIYAQSVEPPNVTATPNNRPANTLAAGAALSGGAAENLSTLTSSDYKIALAKLEATDDINLVCIPDRTDADVQMAMISHAEKTQDRFAVLDSRRGVGLFGANSVEEQRRSVDSTRGYAALYYPWLLVFAAKGEERILVPSSGHVAGICSRIDNTRGVFKAPAGLDSLVNGALGVAVSMSEDEQGQLNLQGINVVRVFQGGGRPTVWGARTTATDRNWQYVNIRRLFLFLEESIQEGIRWAVFEPNNLELWQQLKRTISAFLRQQWRDGALFGATEKDAFYVRIDEALNPPDQRALGRLTIEIGVKPSYPAEFIVVRIGIWQGGSDVTE